MKNLIYLLIAVFAISCNSKPDVTAEVKMIDSLNTEVDGALQYLKTMDTVWAANISQISRNNIFLLEKHYNPDSIDKKELSVVGYYRTFRKVNTKFYKDREGFIKEFKIAKKQLNDLKTDAESGAIKDEDLKNFLNNEKLVTSELLLKFNEFKEASEKTPILFDSIHPLVEKIIEVHGIREKVNNDKKDN